MGPRFRFRTVCYALAELEQRRTKSELEKIVIFVGLNTDYQRKKACDLIKNKTDIINFIAIRIEENSFLKNAEGNFISEEIVQEAARSRHYQEILNEFEEESDELELTDLQRSLMMDGWQIKNNQLQLLALAELPIVPQRNSIVEHVKDFGWIEVERYLENIENALQQGKWESANSSCRTFLNVLFNQLCEKLYSGNGNAPKEGEARKYLNDCNFFQESTKNQALESDFVKALMAMLGMDGAHGGLSNPQNATFNYHLVILVAHLFLTRFVKQYGQT